MKKLFFIAPMALVMLYSSGCKKVETMPSDLNNSPSVIANGKSVEQLLMDTDKKYGTTYSAGNIKGGNGTMGTVTHITHGIYYIPKGQTANNGYCLPHPTNPCWIEITEAGIKNGGNHILSANIDVILNAEGSPELVKDVKEVITHDVLDNNGNVLYTTFEYVQ